MKNSLNNYLQILIENLQKKLITLEQVEELNQKQEEICKSDKIDFEAFDKQVEEKGKLVDQINFLDTGFDSVFERIREELLSNKELYKVQIASMQALIQQVMDAGVSIQASEARNHMLVTAMFQRERDKHKKSYISNSAALRYYQNMNQVNYVDPQLMDKKIGD